MNTIPQTYISRTAAGYQLHHQGQPLTADNRSFTDCVAVAARMKLHTHGENWIGPLGRFGTMTEAKDAKFHEILPDDHGHDAQREAAESPAL